MHPTGVEPVTFGFVDSRTISVIPFPRVTYEDTIANLPPNLPPELEKIVAAWPTLSEPIRRAMLAILIGPDGRVVLCSTRQSSGDPALDAALCAILQPRMRWAPARDRSGKPLTVGILYTAVWSRN